MAVALFVTCLAQQFHPRAAQAVVLVLEHLGHEVVFPTAQTCCGQPLYNNGFRHQARDLAVRMAAVFAGHDVVVCPSASCTAMVRNHFPDLCPAVEVGADAHAQVTRLAAHTVEFAEFLVAQGVDLSAVRHSEGEQVSWHTSCHSRGLGPEDHTATVLGQVPHLSLRPPQRSALCCGFGGTFALAYPAISGAMVDDKVSCLLDTKATTVVSSDTGCTMNIAGRCRRRGAALRFVHLAELLAEGFGLMPREDVGW